MPSDIQYETRYFFSQSLNNQLLKELLVISAVSDPDTAGSVYTKEAEEADRVADDLVVVQVAALAEEDYDRAAAEKFAGSNIICTH
ncbi:hypothetical protein KIN20_030269 [Parelaphostrongylus tenuis]|uniref:Uncharacterized protein n=1 Tax=Parelaphostrongylus tenuis TaxID=148309 RepID=A0AAD5R3L7_PARTN|nr:hypothetical protein KIN20_030269 [Parelaphostrongylus tenuis]